MASESQNTPNGAKARGVDVSTLSYEQARDELIKVVSDLEQGSSSLEESLTLWERGEALARRCEEWLIGAKARLDAARSAAQSSGSQSDSNQTNAATGPDAANSAQDSAP